jgi:hypothetical protein
MQQPVVEEIENDIEHENPPEGPQNIELYVSPDMGASDTDHKAGLADERMRKSRKFMCFSLNARGA